MSTSYVIEYAKTARSSCKNVKCKGTKLMRPRARSRRAALTRFAQARLMLVSSASAR